MEPDYGDLDIENYGLYDKSLDGDVSADWEEKGPALTSAEAEQILSGKRDRLYSAAQKAAVGFFLLAAALMAGFKLNENFLDANSRIGLLMESVSAQDETLSHPKINVRASFRDERQSKLVVPLAVAIDPAQVDIREEFTQKKLIITLSGYSEYFANGQELISDSAIMDAVGIYRQSDNVVVEVYCRDVYDYELAAQDTALTIYFRDIGENYDAVAVVWLPYSDRNRLALPEWKQSLAKFAAEKKIKLFMASDMIEEYTQEEVVRFANEINADFVLGVQAQASGGQQSGLEGICNTAYFMQDLNSAQLAIVMTETFMETTQVAATGFEEAGADEPLVSKATVPSAMVRFHLSRKDMESVENIYQLNEKIVKALENTMGGVLDLYIKTEGTNEG